MTKAKQTIVRKSSGVRPINRLDAVSEGIRGMYALYKNKHVVYIGISDKCVKERLLDHRKQKSGLWTHFRIFKVRKRIDDSALRELEGLITEIYKEDKRANRLNVKRSSSKIPRVPLRKLKP